VADDLTQLELWAAPLLAKLAPAQRRQLAHTIARGLRRAQQQRIAAQKAPDGAPYPARKHRGESLRDKRGALRRKKGAMFAKLRTARWLKANVTNEGAEVGFFGRVARLARVHQEGGMDRINPNGPMAKYPARPLLGFTSTDHAMVRECALEFLHAPVEQGR
jgi:phage virion morphogenesis protein